MCRLRTLSRFFVKDVALNFKMSQMYVSHSRVAVDLGKILQCGSAENKTAKLVVTCDQTCFFLFLGRRGKKYA